jgi:hypothetical protein
MVPAATMNFASPAISPGALQYHNQYAVEISSDRLSYRWRSRELKLVLLDDTLIRFTLAFDEILASSFALRKLRENLVETRHCVAQGNGLAEPNHISDRKPVAHGCVMMHFSHVIPAWI